MNNNIGTRYLSLMESSRPKWLDLMVAVADKKRFLGDGLGKRFDKQNKISAVVDCYSSVDCIGNSPCISQHDTNEIVDRSCEDMIMTIWDAEELIAFKSKYARKENGNIVVDCINASQYNPEENVRKFKLVDPVGCDIGCAYAAVPYARLPDTQHVNGGKR